MLLSYKDRRRYRFNMLQSFIACISLGEEKYSSRCVCAVRVFVADPEVIGCGERDGRTNA